MENIEYDNDIVFVCLRLYFPEVQPMVSIVSKIEIITKLKSFTTMG